jgi:hypothetical protein
MNWHLLWNKIILTWKDVNVIKEMQEKKKKQWSKTMSIMDPIKTPELNPCVQLCHMIYYHSATQSKHRSWTHVLNGVTWFITTLRPNQNTGVEPMCSMVLHDLLPLCDPIKTPELNPCVQWCHMIYYHSAMLHRMELKWHNIINLRKILNKWKIFNFIYK